MAIELTEAHVDCRGEIPARRWEFLVRGFEELLTVPVRIRQESLWTRRHLRCVSRDRRDNHRQKLEFPKPEARTESGEIVNQVRESNADLRGEFVSRSLLEVNGPGDRRAHR